MEPFDYKLLLLRLLPETIMVLGAMVILFLDGALARTAPPARRDSVLSCIGVITASIAILCLSYQHRFGSWLNGMLVLDNTVAVAKQLLLVLGIATLLIAPASRFTRHVGEYYALLLFGLVGMMFMLSTEDLLVAFIALETGSLTLYVLTAFHKGSPASAEAAMKYFLFGSVSAAFTLFGISLVFGMAGSTSFAAIAAALDLASADPLLLAGLAMVGVGFAFKVAAAPFHLWAPDAYHGAPIPSAALVASGSKFAALFLFTKLFVIAFHQSAGSASFGRFASGWMPLVGALAVASLLVGNLVAIAQSNLRRLIAFSAVAHAGNALLATLAASPQSSAAILYYMFTYGLAVIGIFGVIALIETEQGAAQLEDLAGLSRRSPIVAGCLMIFVLSLAGIPPLAGFFGKFYVFLVALKSPAVPSLGLLWLVIVAIAGSAISLYYYLRILKFAYVSGSPVPPDSLPATRLQIVLLALLAAAVLILGCLPNLILNSLLPPV